MTPHVPITPEAIAKDVLDCHQEGTSVYHIHARDIEGKPNHLCNHFQDIMRALDATGCPAIRQISTGTCAGKSPQDRAQPSVYF
jgi:3-keto-5-aminohexanoate cleavage enzyme